MLGNFERSGHEKGKENRSVRGMRHRGEEMKPERERERENRNIKETRAVKECRDDNVCGKLMPRVTIRFICALLAVRHQKSSNLKSP